MPATTADIGAGSRRATIVRFEDAAVRAIFANARDGAAEPAEGFFDAQADALSAITARGALLARTRRFSVELDGLIWLDPAQGAPTIRLVDADQGIDAVMLVSRIEIDLDAERTRVELF